MDKIKQEFSLGVQSYIVARNLLEDNAPTEFEMNANLRTAANRLFMCVEHICNSLMLFEYGGFSEKHHKDKDKGKYEEFSKKHNLKTDIKGLYTNAYNLRSIADYEKQTIIVELKREAVEENLKKSLQLIKETINLLKEHLDENMKKFLDL